VLTGGLPACPQVIFGVVDVRDVADLHLRAMTDPKAKGERFLAVSPQSMTLLQISKTLHDNLGTAAKKAPTYQIPNFVIRLAGLVSVNAAFLASEVGKPKYMTDEKARTVLRWKPRSNVDAVVSTAETLIKLGLVKS
jgi:nucleoside-diphosphate-sugar epimerase